MLWSQVQRRLPAAGHGRQTPRQPATLRIWRVLLRAGNGPAVGSASSQASALRRAAQRASLARCHAASSLDAGDITAQATTASISLAIEARRMPLCNIVPSSGQAEAFVWARHWWPLAPVSFLDTAQPHALTVLGQDLVLWHTRGAAAGSKTGQGGKEGGGEAAGAQAGEWVVMADMCPHRLAPLSEGRLVLPAGAPASDAGGEVQLQCSYHGWQFGPSGACAKITQLSDPKACASALASRRSCAQVFHSQVAGGLLWAWMDNSAEGRALAGAASPCLPPAEVLAGAFDWTAAQVPNDYRFWVEQGMDPAHANFLHHQTLGFDFKHALAMEAAAVDTGRVDLHHGFIWSHGPYEAKPKQSGIVHAWREWQPPYLIKTRYDMANGSTVSSALYQVPVKPGSAMIISKFSVTPTVKVAPPPKYPSDSYASPQHADCAVGAAGGSSGAATVAAHVVAGDSTGGTMLDGKKGDGEPFWIKLLAAVGLLMTVMKIPHWLFQGFAVMDQDVVIMNRQERLMAGRGLGSRDYALFARADEGVRAINTWLGLAGYAHLWEQQQTLLLAHPQAATNGSASPVPAFAAGRAPMPPGVTADTLPLEQLLDRQRTHVRFCKECQQGAVFVDRVVSVFRGASIALGALAAFELISALMFATQAVAARAGAAPSIVQLLLTPGLLITIAGCWLLAGWAKGLRAFHTDRFVSGVDEWRKRGGLARA